MSAARFNASVFRWQTYIVQIIIFLALSPLFHIYTPSASARPTKSTICARSEIKLTTPKLNVPSAILHNWAQNAPFFPLDNYAPPPDACRITQVNILQRHGARFPTSGSSTQMKTSVAKIQAVGKSITNPAFKFIANFTYDLGHDDLVPFGAAESFDAGQIAFERYKSLISTRNIPFVRSDSSSRVVQSATNWTAGFAKASQNKYKPSLNVILDSSGNDTLENTCPNIGSLTPQTNAWQAVYAQPILTRFNRAAPGSNLTLDDISNLISLCNFETVAKEAKSPWCDLFAQDDYEGFEYFGDLGKFYGTGYGQPLGPVEGVGYVNELIARLTHTPVQDQTQTNHTLDGSPLTFPLDRTLYADFSHDNQLVAIFSAMGLFKQPKALDPTKPDKKRTWVASRLVPFAGKLVTERISCSNKGKKTETVLRMLVNDQVQDLTFCGADKNGMCTVDAFVKSQVFARENGEGNFQKCFS